MSTHELSSIHIPERTSLSAVRTSRPRTRLLRPTAVRTTLTIEGQRYRVDAPRKRTYARLAKKGTVIPTVTDVADALVRLSSATRENIRRIVVVPRKKTSGAYVSQLLGKTVVVYGPLATRLAGYLLHESGHLVAFQSLGRFALGRRWRAWRKAMKQDGQAITPYARTNVHEDFAESWLAYHGIPYVRPALPNRFRVMDEIDAKMTQGSAPKVSP